MTSPVRVALAREITIVARQDPDLRARLDLDLEAQGFEVRTNAELLKMAADYGVPARRIDEIQSTRSADLSPVQRRYHCRDCKDERLIGNDEDGWVPCSNCNAIPADAVFDPSLC